MGVAMVDDSEFRYLMEQVQRAREALGVALGSVQDIDPDKLDVENITMLLAGSVRALFAAEEQRLSDSSFINDAMDNLRQILGTMQDATVQNDKLDEATATVARILAILFPVLKALPSINEQPADQEAPLPLTGAMMSTVDTNDDRRDNKRVAIEADMGMHSDSNFFAGFSMDISSGGLFVATYDIPELGTPVNLNFKIPNGPVLCLDGVIRWIREYNDTTPEMPPGIGVKFENLSNENSQIINNFMNKKQPLFYDEE